MLTSNAALTTTNIRSVFDKTLDNLGVDYVDAYLLHHPYFAKGKEQLQTAWAEIEAIYDSGKVGEIGVSNCTPEHIEIILQTAKIRPTLNQVELNPYLQRVQLQKYHSEHGIKTSAFSPLSPIVRAYPGPLDDPLKALSEKRGVSTAVILICWALRQDIAVVTTSTDPERMKDHLKAMNFVLSQGEMDMISWVGSTKHFRGRWTNIFAEDDRS
jgi:diketogulonate reductase-like aldo/keto reductase